MRKIRFAFAAAAIALSAAALAEVPKPAALSADGIPPVPDELAATSRPYMEFRTAGFAGWNPADRSMLVATRFANTNQLHGVAMPLGMRRQISFEPEPVSGEWSPKGDVLVVIKDNGGDEFFQLHRLGDGRLTLLTDSKSRNNFGTWDKEGRLVGYSSTRRNGTDTDLYVMDPRDPRSDRKVAEVKGGGWGISDFAPGGGRAAVLEYISITKSNPFLLDIATGKLTPIGDHSKAIYYNDLKYAPDGTLWATSDEDSDFQRLGTLDPASVRITRWTESETGGLDPRANVEPELVEVKSFDGEPVSGFLYRPDARRFPGKRPLIVNIHGGPESQTRPGFLGRNNYLVNELGIAIFYPNVRGSSGYGKRFVSLDNGPFQRENSVKDIGAFLDRLERDPGLDSARMSVTGGSYGGYMCYASAIFYSGRFKGALCNVAISNFVSFLENTQSYRRDLRRAEYGDERDPKQRAKLLEIAPLRRMAEIRAPLYVIQGANDPRVPKSEADQIVKAVRARGNEVWYLVGENEGHGFAKKENLDYQFWTTLMFWQKHLLAK